MSSPGTSPEISPGPPAGPAAPPARPTVVDWILVLWLSALSGAIAFVGLFFLPWYRGSTPLPVVAVVLAPALAVLPRMAYRLTGRLSAAIAPVLAWIAVTVGLYLAANPLYNATSPTGPTGVPVTWQGWQFVLWVGLGALAAAVSVGLLWGDHLRADITARRGADRSGGREVRAPLAAGDTDR